jgi:hypothetical protein
MDKRKYNFYWGLLGNLELGRPNLGPTSRLEVYRLMQFSLRDVLEQHLGTEPADLIFYEAGTPRRGISMPLSSSSRALSKTWASAFFGWRGPIWKPTPIMNFAPMMKGSSRVCWRAFQARVLW